MVLPLAARCVWGAAKQPVAAAVAGGWGRRLRRDFGTAAATAPAHPLQSQAVDLKALAEKGFFDAAYADTLKQVRSTAATVSAWCALQLLCRRCGI